MVYKFIFFYLLIFNLWGYFLMGFDKKRAIKQKSRVSEKFIWQITLVGGSIGVYLGMKRFRHKTLHKIFTYGVPAIIFLQLATLLVLGTFLKE